MLGRVQWRHPRGPPVHGLPGRRRVPATPRRPGEPARDRAGVGHRQPVLVVRGDDRLRPGAAAGAARRLHRRPLRDSRYTTAVPISRPPTARSARRRSAVSSSTRRGSGSGCSTGWPRSAGWTAAGLTRAGSAGRCSESGALAGREPRRRRSGPAPTTPGVLRDARSPTRPIPDVPRPATATIDRFGAEDGLRDGGVCVVRRSTARSIHALGRLAGRTSSRAFDPAARRVRDAIPSSTGLADQPPDGSFGIAPAADGQRVRQRGKGTARAGTRDGRRAAGPSTTATFSRFGRCRTGFPLSSNPTAWPGSAGSAAARALRPGRRATRRRPRFAVLVRRVTAGQDRVLLSGRVRGHRDAAAAGLDARCGSSSRRRRSSTRPPPSTRRGSTASTPTGRRGRARPAATTPISASATTGSTSARATSPAGQRGGDLRASRSCRPGTARGGPMLAYLLLGAGLVFGVDRVQRRRLLGKERERAQFAEARLRAESAEALARTESEGKKQRRAAERASAARSPRRSTSTPSSASSTSASTSSPTPTSSASASTTPSGSEIEYRLAIEEGKRYAPVHARHQRPRSAAGLVHRAPPAGVHQRPRTPSTRSTSAATTRRASGSKTARCRRRRSRSSTCRSRPRTACSASSRSRASRRTPTPSTT